ncbi:MAG: flagellar motor protein MotB [Candidatus Brocadiaceae bacterium]|uniref:OmpA/MotB family protein n=1 Tax=Candidatus Wunengus sp. YC61 TaxID=3367698 RepID=UPI00271F918F|nr:flagellar motor protein MotB [Candidatus Brocadiaceae bacterium]
MSDEEGGGGGHGGPVWLLTYCDLITLLVAFFVMMISFSSINVNKCKEDMPKIEEGFAGGGGHFLEDGTSPVENIFKKDLDVLESPGAEEQPIESQIEPEDMYNYISVFVEESGLKNSIGIEDVKIGCKIKIPVDLCFEKGGSVVKKEAYRIFDKLGGVLRNLRSKLVIDTNMGKAEKEIDLSINRAAAICEFLVTREDIEPQKIAISGYRVAEAKENTITMMIFK